MNLVRINPFPEFRGLNSVVDRFFEDEVAWPAKQMRSWSPVVDVTETKDELLFAIELPGFEKDEVEITVENRELRISGERKQVEDKDSTRHRSERWYGRFLRSFRLPPTVDEEKISANLKNGLLTLTLPKKEEIKPKQIPVKVS